MSSKNLKNKNQLLCEVLASLSSSEEIALLLEDLCTVKELEQMEQRLCSAVLLMEGKTYAQVTEETGISTVTLSRVSRALQYGSGGYSNLLRSYINSSKETNQ